MAKSATPEDHEMSARRYNTPNRIVAIKSCRRRGEERGRKRRKRKERGERKARGEGREGKRKMREKGGEEEEGNRREKEREVKYKWLST